MCSENILYLCGKIINHSHFIMEISQLKQAFLEAYNHDAAAVFFSPGRVNLIGEHTDYNGGHVFPCALSFGIYLLIAPNDCKQWRFRSLNLPEIISIDVTSAPKKLPNNSWANYPLGVFAQFLKNGVRIESGYDILAWGNVPAGAGLSSSAALEVVTAYALDTMLGTHLDRTQMALYGQAAEHDFAGVNCGIMDQFASAQGKQDHAIDLDCTTLQYELVPIKLDGMKVVVTNTHSPHKLDSGAYNTRVAQCQEALSQIRALGFSHIENLAQLSQSDFDSIADLISDPVAKMRARHVVGEVARTNEAIAALKQGNITRFGQLMNLSHLSLRDDYEVTGPQLDALAEAAWHVDGVIGSRMTGGGFGGCTVSIVRDEAIDLFIEQVSKEYTQRTGLKADFYIAQIGDGAKQLE